VAFDFNSIIDNVVTAIVGAGTGWFFGRRGSNAAAAVTEGDAILKMQESYKTFVEDANVKFSEMKEEIKVLHIDLNAVRKELENCKKFSGLK